MRLIYLFLLIFIFYIGCSQKTTNIEWAEVKSDKANFSVECPKKVDSGDLIKVQFDEVKKTGSLTCVVGETTFYVESSEWNVSETPQENSDRFFETLKARGLRETKKVILNSAGEKAVQDIDSTFQSIGQHFIIDKTAFHLSAAFRDKTTQETKKGKLDAKQIELAERFFNSFRTLKK